MNDQPIALAQQISDWQSLVAAVGPHLMADSPIDSLRASGVELTGEVASAFGLLNASSQLIRGPGSDLMAMLRAEYGVLPTSLHLGRTPHEPAPSLTTGFALVGTADLAVANEVLAELFRVGTIRRELTAAQTGQLIDLDGLRAACTGVPDVATLGQLRFPVPWRTAASRINLRNLHLDVEFELPVLGSQPASLRGVLGMEVALDFTVFESVVRPALGAVNDATGTLTIHSDSVVQPRSEAARQQLEQTFVEGARGALILLTQGATSPAKFSVSIPVHKSRFPNSTIDITQMAGVTLRQSGRDHAVVGLNVERSREIDPIALAGQLIPTPPRNLRTVVDEEFAADSLSSTITSGDLAAFINRVIDRHALGLDIADVRVDGGGISFREGKLVATIDCTWVDACVLNKDLSFTATLIGWPALKDGTLTISGSSIDFDLDNTDAVICALTSALLGPFGVLLQLGVSAFLAAYNPSSSDLDIPVAETSNPLPGSDKVLDLELTSASMSTDVLVSEGNLALITDPLRIYAYLRVVQELHPQAHIPIVGATVELYELDSPPPDGDDVVDPSSYTEYVTELFQVTEEVTYNPRADEWLGSGVTDENGRVTFVVISDMLGGSATRTRVHENFRTGQVSVTTRQELVGEALPDLAVSVRSSDGRLLLGRRLVGLNVTNRRFGRFDRPIDVSIDPVLIEPDPDPGGGGPAPTPMTTVPDVRELAKRAAAAQISAAGLRVRTVGNDGPTAWVFSQSPRGGEVVAQGSLVSLSLRTEPRH